MKTKNTWILSLILLGIPVFGFTQDYHVRVGFLGNSITIGTGLSNPGRDCYPSQIAKMLEAKYGDTCIVKNFAVSGRTMLKKGDYPLWKESAFKEGLNFAPDIVFICLGTNDTKPYNWDANKKDFVGNYLTMIDTFKLRNPNAKFIVCYPPPAFDVVYDIRNAVLIGEVIPDIDSVLSKREATKIDFYHPLLDSVKLFPDFIHPNAAGATVMANIAFDTIVKTDIVHKVITGTTFVLSLKSNLAEIKVNDSITLSWTTVNANSVLLNHLNVPVNGSIKLAPRVTTDYKLVASGNSGKDSITIQVKVYEPIVSSIIIEPYRVTIKKGESLNLTLLYYDQKREIMPDTIISSSWKISEGSGSLINITDTSATFVADSIGKSKVQVQVGEIIFTATITVLAESGISQSETYLKQSGYPNPCENVFNLSISEKGPVSLRIFDMTGKLQLEKIEVYSDSGKTNFSVNVEELNPGIYIYDVEIQERHLSGKIYKK